MLAWPLRLCGRRNFMFSAPTCVLRASVVSATSLSTVVAMSWKRVADSTAATRSWKVYGTSARGDKGGLSWLVSWAGG